MAEVAEVQQVEQLHPEAVPSVIDPLLQLKHMLFLGSEPQKFNAGLPCLRDVEEYRSNEKKQQRFGHKEHRLKSLEEQSDKLRSSLFDSHSVIVNMVRDGRHQEVLESLTAATEKQTCCWQEIMSCLATMVRGEHANAKASHAAYVMLPSLVKHSGMLFFFLQSLKLASVGKRIGWGRGLRTAVRRWYSELTPAQLLLELWCCPHQYGWHHKDVVKLVHLQQGQLVLGSKVILQWFFSSLHRTKVLFSAERDAAQYIGWLDNVCNKDHQDLPMKRMTTFVELSGSPYQMCRDQDPMFQCPEELAGLLEHLSGAAVIRLVQDPHFISRVASRKEAAPATVDAGDEAAVQAGKELPEPNASQRTHCTLMLDRLLKGDVAQQAAPTDVIMALNNFHRRLRSHVENLHGRSKWRGGATDRLRANKGKLGGPAPHHLQGIVHQLEELVMASIEHHQLSAALPGVLLFFEPSNNLPKFVNSNLGINVHKQMRVNQVMYILSRILCSRPEDGFGDRVYKPHMSTDGAAAEDTKLKAITCSNADLNTSLEDFEKQIAITRIDSHVLSFESVCAHADSLSRHQLVYCAQMVSARQLDQAYQYISAPHRAIKQIVLVSCENTYLTARPEFDPRVLVVNGFDHRALDLIANFLLQKF